MSSRAIDSARRSLALPVRCPRRHLAPGGRVSSRAVELARRSLALPMHVTLTGLPRQYVDLPLIGPIVRVLDQTLPHGIVANVIPLLGVVL